MPENSKTQHLVPTSGFDLLQLTLAALISTQRTTGGHDDTGESSCSGISLGDTSYRNVATGQPTLLPPQSKVMREGLLGGGTKPSVLRKRLLFHCSTISWAAVWQETGVLPESMRVNATGSEERRTGAADTLEASLRHVLTRELQRRAVQQEREVRSASGLFVSSPSSRMAEQQTDNQSAAAAVNINPDLSQSTPSQDEYISSNSPRPHSRVPLNGNHQMAALESNGSTMVESSAVLRELAPSPEPPSATTILTKHSTALSGPPADSGGIGPVPSVTTPNSTAQSYATRRGPPTEGASVRDTGLFSWKPIASTNGRPQSNFSASYVADGGQLLSSSPRPSTSTPAHGHDFQGRVTTGRPAGARPAPYITSAVHVNSGARDGRPFPGDKSVSISRDFYEPADAVSMTMETMRARTARPLFREDVMGLGKATGSDGNWPGEGRVLGATPVCQPSTADKTEQIDTLLPSPTVHPDMISPRSLPPETVTVATKRKPSARAGTLASTHPGANRIRSKTDANVQTEATKRAQNSMGRVRRYRRVDVPLRPATIYFDQYPPLPTHTNRRKHARGQAGTRPANGSSHPPPWRPAGTSSLPVPPPPDVSKGRRNEEEKRLRDFTDDILDPDRMVSSANGPLSGSTSAHRGSGKDAGPRRRRPRRLGRQQRVEGRVRPAAASAASSSGRGPSAGDGEEVPSAWSRIRKQTARAIRRSGRNGGGFDDDDDDSNGEGNLRNGSLSDQETYVRSGRERMAARREMAGDHSQGGVVLSAFDDSKTDNIEGTSPSSVFYSAAKKTWDAWDEESHDNQRLDGAPNRTRSFRATESPSIDIRSSSENGGSSAPLIWGQNLGHREEAAGRRGAAMGPPGKRRGVTAVEHNRSAKVPALSLSSTLSNYDGQLLEKDLNQSMTNVNIAHGEAERLPTSFQYGVLTNNVMGRSNRDIGRIAPAATNASGNADLLAPRISLNTDWWKLGVHDEKPVSRGRTEQDHPLATTTALLAQAGGGGGEQNATRNTLLGAVRDNMVGNGTTSERDTRSGIVRLAERSATREREVEWAMDVVRRVAGKKAGDGASTSTAEGDASLPVDIAWGDGQDDVTRQETEPSSAVKWGKTGSTVKGRKPSSVVDDAKAWMDKVRAGLCW